MSFLFILHTANINGATKSISFFIQFLINNKNKIDYISLDNSLLKNVSGAKNIKLKYNILKDKSFRNLINYVLGRDLISIYEKNIIKLLKSNYSIVYANTIVTLKLAVDLKKKNKSLKLILHLHEMETIIRQNIENLSVYDNYIYLYLVVSKYTQTYLLSIGVRPEKIVLIPECSSIPKVQKNSFILKDIFNVAMVGEAHWRKGDDLFLLTAKKTILLNPHIHFYWIGRVEPYRKIILDQDIKKLEISSNVTFISEVLNPQDYLALMDLFILTSREDPFPLAAIEAGMLGLPIVCFEKTTGLEDDIKETGGEVVPYLDIDVMSRSITKFYENRSDIHNNKKYIMDYFEKFKPEIICEQLYNVITENR